ncbi:MAG: hypothetical protein U9O94_06190 [Nanoarchaeota archaeon]|nr:hypothetical protein [Nanoarchaeota archaeon]
MQYFVVNKCTESACRYYRFGDNCAKNGMDIQMQIDTITNIQENHICEVKRQMNIFRLAKLIKE